MRIIFLEAVQSYGGARKSTVELAARLKSLGHKVLIVDFWGSNLEFVEAVENEQLDLRIIEPRVEPFVISSGSKLNYMKNAITYFFIQKKYRKLFSNIVDEFKPDIISVNNLKCLNILKPNASYKIDYLARGWFSFISLSNFTKKKLKKFNPRFLTVSQSTRQAIYTGGVSKFENIKVLTDVIETKMFNNYHLSFKEFSQNNPLKILHSGGFLKTKGQHTCLEVAKELKLRKISFEMTLTGIIYDGNDSQPYYNKIVDLIKKYDLESYVAVVVNPPNIMDYFKNTDILIHPSHTEGLPRVCLEALAFGKPIIANPAGGVTDVVIHGLTGYITDFNDIEQYADYIGMYYNNMDLYKSHSISGRQLISQNYLDVNQLESIKRIFPH